jgi:virginiamycin A acetyltransferase
VAGNPASVRRLRFSPAQIAVLEQLMWWDWPIDKILKHEALICGGNVAALAEVAP